MDVTEGTSGHVSILFLCSILEPARRVCHFGTNERIRAMLQAFYFEQRGIPMTGAAEKEKRQAALVTEQATRITASPSEGPKFITETAIFFNDSRCMIISSQRQTIDA